MDMMILLLDQITIFILETLIYVVDMDIWIDFALQDVRIVKLSFSMDIVVNLSVDIL